jgi:hypothetical protein
MIERTNHKLISKFSYDNKIIQKSGDARVYNNAILLTPGSWSDAMTKAPVEYTDKQLSKSASRWEENYLNIDHSRGTLDRIGLVKNPKWYKGAVMADLYIYPITQRARDTIALIDAGLVNSLSVELSSVDRWDFNTNKRFAEDISFFGTAVVLDPACTSTKIR